MEMMHCIEFYHHMVHTVHIDVWIISSTFLHTVRFLKLQIFLSFNLFRSSGALCYNCEYIDPRFLFNVKEWIKQRIWWLLRKLLKIWECKAMCSTLRWTNQAFWVHEWFFFFSFHRALRSIKTHQVNNVSTLRQLWVNYINSFCTLHQDLLRVPPGFFYLPACGIRITPVQRIKIQH